MAEINIPDKYYEKFKKRAPQKGFETPEEYIQDVLRQVYEKLEKKDDTEYSEEQEKKVKDKLKDLGYMD